jgi:hypothetical protein
VGNHWGHGMPSGLFAFSSIYGSVSGAGPESAQSAFRTKGKQTPARPVLKQFFLPHTFGTAMVTCLMTPKVIHATVPVPQPRAEGSRAWAFPRGETRVLRQRGNPLPQRRTRGSMPGPFANNFMFTPLSVHTTHFNFPVVGR